METEEILITVRTYPTFSKRYIETVCTGGINRGGEWRRLYPVPLRYLDEEQQFRTFDVISVGLRPGNDGRLESRKPEMSSLKIIDHLDGWPARCLWVNPTIMPSIAAMQDAKKSIASVAVCDVLDLIAEPTDADWSVEQKEILKQELMFGERLPLEKIPFDFRVMWRDGDGKEHSSLVIAWELAQTWRQFKRQYSDPIRVVREKFMTDVFGPDKKLSLFMGNHSRFRDIFMVCGWFIPPKELASNESLF